jgi:hypothetical protein
MTPIRDGWTWAKGVWKAHPSATGAVAAGAAVVAVLGTGGAALVLGVPTVLAGAGISKAIAGDPGVQEPKKEEKKEEEKK